MYAHFIDVGQANATVLEFPCGAVLIDAGAQDTVHVTKLLNYLSAFFNRRTDLNRTLQAIIITHNHIDHTRALREVVERFTVKRYIDNGQLSGTGTEDPNWVRNNAVTGGRNIKLRDISDDLVPSQPYAAGLTDEDIDPISCPTCDPKIFILSGRLNTSPGWTDKQFKDKNNHSLITRVEFGQASFLFTGDAEVPAIQRIVTNYASVATLDADIYHAGHHGSHNGTTHRLLDAVTPYIAIISVGSWDDGKTPPKQFSTYSYGHPRRVIIDLLNDAIPGNRNHPVQAMVANGVKNFEPMIIRKKIFATGWDGTIRIRATTTGAYRAYSYH